MAASFFFLVLFDIESVFGLLCRISLRQCIGVFLAFQCGILLAANKTNWGTPQIS